MKFKRILLCGSYGRMNTGDDSFCLVGGEGSLRYWGGEELVYASQNITQLPFNCNKVLPSKLVFRGHASLAISLASMRAKMILYAGGSVFQNAQPILNYKTMQKLLARHWKKMLVAIGVSVGPLRSEKDEKYIKNFLKDFCYISVRDSRSYNAIMEMNIPRKPVLSFDLAAMIPMMFPENSIKKRRRFARRIIGVSVCHYERYVRGGNLEIEAQREKRILDAIKEFYLRGMIDEVRFIVMNGNPAWGDEKLSRKFATELSKFMKVSIIPYHPNVLTMVKSIQECDIILAVRLHASVFAYLYSVPFVLVEYHKKCSDFLDEIGYDRDLRVPSNCGRSGYITEILSQVVQKQYRPKLSTVDAMKRSEYNFTLAPWYNDKLKTNSRNA